MTSKTIEIYLPDGEPTGIRIAEIRNRTVQLVAFPRTRLSSVQDISREGIYFLFGTDTELSDRSLVYIGQAKDCLQRIKQHNQDPAKDYWNTAAREVDELVHRRGITVVEEFQESESAYKPGERVVFDEMMRRIEAGEADGVACYKLDRMSRNPVDEGRIKWALQTGKLKQVATCMGDYFTADHSIPISVEFAQATQYSRDVSTGVKRGLKTKILHGHYPHKAPVGWLNRKHLEQGARDIVADPDRFDLVQRMIRKVLDNELTPMRALRLATDEWGLRTKNVKKRVAAHYHSLHFTAF